MIKSPTQDRLATEWHITQLANTSTMTPAALSVVNTLTIQPAALIGVNPSAPLTVIK